MTRRALELFNKHAGLQLATKVASLDALDATRSKTSRICPLVCERGYHAEREACVKTVCTAGLVLGEDGACVKRPERPAAQPSAKRPTPTRTAKPSDGGSHASGDARKRAAGGGHVTCGRNGCQTVPAGCHAVRGAGGGGLGGKIFCP